ncbi:MAG: porin, partial [Candidatus Brocadiales bacterium]
MKQLWLMTTLLVLALSSTTLADQDPEIQYLIDRLQALEETVKTQREEIGSLKEELGALKGSQGRSRVSRYETVGYEPNDTATHEYGVSEEKLHDAVRDYLGTEEGKQLVTDASPARFKAGYKVGKGFYLQTLDDKFRLQIIQRTNLRYTFVNNDDAEDTSSFRIRRQRIKFKGHAFTKDLTYKVYWGLAAGSGAGELKDAYVNYKLTDGLQFRAGQYKVPFNRQRLNSSSKLQFVDRSKANDEFQLDRDIGVMLHGEPMKGMFEYYLAMMQGAGKNTSTNTNNKHLYVARFAVNPFGKFKSYSEPDLEYEETPKLALGAAYAVNNGEQVFVRDEVTTFNRD